MIIPLTFLIKVFAYFFCYFSILNTVISYFQLITPCNVVPLAIHWFTVNCNYIYTMMMLRDAPKR